MMRWHKLLSLLIALLGAMIGIAYAFPLPPNRITRTNVEDVTRLVFAPDSAQPYLITRGGMLFEPVPGKWRQVNIDAKVNDLYLEKPDRRWAGTDSGLLTYEDGQWQLVEGIAPTKIVESMHGFLFALGDEGVSRLSKDWRQLKIPAPAEPVMGLVMLGDHSHVILNDGLAVTHDMGLSWEMIETPVNIRLIGIDAEDNLLAVTDAELRRWDYRAKTWSIVAPFPDNQPIEALEVFQDQLYTLAGGQLYRLTVQAWEKVELPAENGYYLSALQFHYPAELWVAAADKLWWSTDGKIWQVIKLQL